MKQIQEFRYVRNYLNVLWFGKGDFIEFSLPNQTIMMRYNPFFFLLLQSTNYFNFISIECLNKPQTNTVFFL